MKIYRSLRSEELIKLHYKHGLRAHCDNCKCKDCVVEECCNINERQHVNSGTKAKTKSRYISATHDEKIAAWWSANNDGNPKTNGKSASYVEIDIPQHLVIDTCVRDYGSTANNRAKSSCEVLIKDYVPMKYITSIYRVRKISKTEFDSIPDSYNKNGFSFKKIYYNVQQKDKYMIVLVLKLSETTFNIRYANFPKDYLLNNIHKTNIESEEDKMDSSGWITEVEHPPTPEGQSVLPPQSSIIQNTQRTKIKKTIKSSNHSIKSKRNKTTKSMNTKYTDELTQKYNLDISEVRDYLRQPDSENKYFPDDYSDERAARQLVIIFRFMEKNPQKDNVISYFNDNRYSYPFKTFIEDINQRNPDMNSYIANILEHYYYVIKQQQLHRQMEGNGKKKKTRKKKQTKRNKK